MGPAGSRDSSVSTVTRLRAGRPGFDSRHGLRISSLRHRCAQIGSGTHPASYPTRTGSAALSLEVKQPGREADHSTPSGAEVKNLWRYISTSPYVFMEWCLVTCRRSFPATHQLAPLVSLPVPVCWLSLSSAWASRVTGSHTVKLFTVSPRLYDVKPNARHEDVLGEWTYSSAHS
jgi:hypothetical protein